MLIFAHRESRRFFGKSSLLSALRLMDRLRLWALTSSLINQASGGFGGAGFAGRDYSVILTENAPQEVSITEMAIIVITVVEGILALPRSLVE